MTAALLLLAGLALLLVEVRLARRRGATVYTPHHVATNLRCGALRLLGAVLTHAPLLGIYHLAQQRWGALALGTGPATWALGFVLYDLLYYWEHRLAHRHGLLWAVHGVHHQATEYDLTMGFRVGALGPLAAFPFFLPLAFLGVPAEVYLGAAIASTAAMFMLHSRFIGDLGPIGRVLNSPAAHRLHHAARDTHTHRNFGGVLIIWDRLFGTYQAGPAPAAYGLGAPAPTSARAANLAPLRAWLQGAGRAQVAHTLQASLVYPTVILAVWATVRVTPNVLTGLALLPLAVLLTDLLSGAAHWALDQHVSPDRGALAWLARAFHEHHDRPGKTAKLPFYTSTWETAVFMGPAILLLGVFAGPGVGASLATMVFSLALLAPTAHKLAHRRVKSPAVRWLQDKGVLLSPRAHAQHHRGDHTRALCVFTGWCNPLLDRLDVWRGAAAAHHRRRDARSRHDPPLGPPASKTRSTPGPSVRAATNS